MARALSPSLLATFTILLLLLPGQSFAAAFGTLSNFDVVNDTSGPCHGFEIELEDIHPGAVGSALRGCTPL